MVDCERELDCADSRQQTRGCDRAAVRRYKALLVERRLGPQTNFDITFRRVDTFFAHAERVTNHTDTSIVQDVVSSFAQESRRHKHKIHFVGTMTRDSSVHVYAATEPPPEIEAVGKVTFVESSHRYYLFDGERVSGEFMVSGSALMGYVRQWHKKHDIPPEEKLRHVSALAASGGGGMQKKYFHSTHEVVCRIFTDYINQFRGVGGVEYRARRAAMMKLCPKDYTYFVPSWVFEAVENYLASGRDHHLDEFDGCSNGLYWFLCFMGGAEDPTYSRLYNSGLRGFLAMWTHRFKPAGRGLVTPTADDVIECYHIPSRAGTALHAYLERVLQGQSTDDVDLHDRADLEQARSFVEWTVAQNIKFHALEQRLGSFVHMLGGSVDAISQSDDGSYMIWDWKRVGKWLECAWLDTEVRDLHINNLDHTLGSEMVKYMIQLAIYRKLFMLQDPTHLVHETACLVVFHPGLKTWHRLVIQLGTKLRPDTNTFFPIYGKGPFSPIEYVDLMFDERSQHLEMYLSRT